MNQVPLTFDGEAFRETVGTVAERRGLRVEETGSAFRLVVSAA